MSLVELATFCGNGKVLTADIDLINIVVVHASHARYVLT